MRYDQRIIFLIKFCANFPSTSMDHEMLISSSTIENDIPAFSVNAYN